MTAMTPTAPAPARSRPPGALASTLAVAHRELREAVRARWFLLYSLAFAALGLGVSYVSAASAGGAGLSGYGRTTAGLVNIVLLVVPLMALSAGASSVASDRERGMLAYLLSQPLARVEVMLGKFLGLAGALAASILLGLGACAAVLALKSGAAGAGAMAHLAASAIVLALAMLAVGMLVSTLARKASVAVGAAVFLWFVLVFVTDLGLMAGVLALKVRVEHLFTLGAANPLQAFKMWTLHNADASLDVLGPAGLYASEEFGPRLNFILGGALAAWVVLPLAAACLIFSRRSPV